MSLLGPPRQLEWSSQRREGNATPILSSWDRNPRLRKGHGKGTKQGLQGQGSGTERLRRQASQGG